MVILSVAKNLIKSSLQNTDNREKTLRYAQGDNLGDRGQTSDNRFATKDHSFFTKSQIT